MSRCICHQWSRLATRSNGPSFIQGVVRTDGQRQTVRHASRRANASSEIPSDTPASLRPPSSGQPPRPPAAAAKPKSHPSSRERLEQREKQQRQKQKEAEEAASGKPAQSVADLVRARWIALFGAGAAALCLGAFGASTIMAYARKTPCDHRQPEPAVPTGRPAIQSPLEFDAHLDKSEWRLGITRLRRRLAGDAKGHVLEVAFGTGRNLEFYDWAKVTEHLVTSQERTREKLKKNRWGAGVAGRLDDIEELESFTGVDIAQDMLDLGLKRARQVVPHAADLLPKNPSFADLAQTGAGVGAQPTVALLDGRLRIVRSDAQSALPVPPAAAKGGKYDMVVQTFGLCSVRDPVGLVANMAAVLQPETGRLVLVEHGRSMWELVNGMLDRTATEHFERFGCWWNRDIEAVIREAERRVPGLEVVAIQRPGWFTLGTHLWIELRIRDVKPQEAKGTEMQDKHSNSGWFGWAVAEPKPKKAGP